MEQQGMHARTPESPRQPVVEQEGTSPLLGRDDDAEVQHFPLTGILPQGHVLAVSPRLGIVAHLSCEKTAPRILAMQHFGDIELALLLPLLRAFPHYCPNELLLATFSNSNVTASAVARAREQLDEAVREGTSEYVMKPARAVLSRCRPRLQEMGLRIVSRRVQGYQLLSS